MVHTPPITVVRDRLEVMFARQRAFLDIVPPLRAFPSEDPAVLMDQVREQALAIITEVAEVLDETGWKPWASSNHINTDAYRGELIDVWCFFMNLCLLGGMTPDDLYRGYLRKLAVNIQRVADGYDGVSTKCPGCKGAYDDPATKCRPGSTAPVIQGSVKINPWCFKLGRHVIAAEAQL